MQCYRAPLQNDTFINQLAGTAADFAVGHSCQTNQLFFLLGTRPHSRGFCIIPCSSSCRILLCGVALRP